MKIIESFEEFINEKAPSDRWYKELGSLERKGDTISDEEQEKVVDYLTQNVESQSGFEFSEVSDDGLSFYLDNGDIKVGASIVKKGSKYMWKAMCSDSSLEDGGVDDNGTGSLEDAMDGISEFVLSTNDLLYNG
tara:strand:+ start:861 stop:1262 length:402 start_codon:yes stop_codon:yes gene_type:complete